MVDRPQKVIAATSIRLATSLAAVSLFAGGFVLLFDAAGLSLFTNRKVLSVDSPSLLRPSMVYLSAILTFIMGGLSLLSGLLVLRGHRKGAIVLLSIILFFLVFFPTIRFTPGLVRSLYLMDLETLFPPMWLYSVAIPLLIFVLTETAIKTRQASSVPGRLLFMTLLASVMVLYFGLTMIGGLIIGLLSRDPLMAFNSHLAVVALSGFVVLGIVLARKGLAVPGVTLLLTMGLLIEWVSIHFYPGLPKYVEIFEGRSFVESMLPQMAVLGGTVPGFVIGMAVVIFLFGSLSRQVQEPGELEAEASVGTLAYESASGEASASPHAGGEA